VYSDNVIVDLRVPTGIWRVPPGELPARTLSPKGDQLQIVTLPNASVCADFLMNPPNVWSGISVGVNPSDVLRIFKAFDGANSSNLHRVQPEMAAKIQRYSQYPGWGWIEYVWADTKDAELIGVQTTGIAWYALGDYDDKDLTIVGIALQDIRHLLWEADLDLSLPIGDSAGNEIIDYLRAAVSGRSEAG